MIKHILFICLLLGSFISGKCQLIIQGNSSNQLARFAELETLDNSSMECIYRHRLQTQHCLKGEWRMKSCKTVQTIPNIGSMAGIR